MITSSQKQRPSAENLISKQIVELHRYLLQWYRKFKRDLPWRRTKDPYYIWVSEVMLQQTRVDTVIPYYQKFIEKFPTVKHLATSNEHDVLKQWQGLGYYRRAKMIHNAAKEIHENYGGKLPSTQTELQELPGFGPYTSGAVASIAFDEAVPALDGNVKRVLSRIFATNKGIEELAEKASKVHSPSEWTQALMELGALVCTPKNPKCLICPVQKDCLAYQAQTIDLYPQKITKAKPKKIYAVVSMIRNKSDQVLIQQRSSEGRWSNMWEFPTVESDQPFVSKPKHIIGSFVHQLTHRTMYIDVIQAPLKSNRELLKSHKWVSFDEIKDYPFSTMQLIALEQFIKNRKY